MIQTQTEGRRTYILGDTYPFRDRIRALGAHWDAGRKAWWTAKRDAAEQLVSELNAAAAADTSAAATRGENSGGNRAPRDGIHSIVAGRATYKGRTYYVAGRVEKGRTHWDDTVVAVATQDGSKLLLYFRDGSSQFWASRSEVEIVKRYDRPQTINGLRKFAHEAKEAGSAELAACKRRGWDGVIGSPSYYSSGAFDEIDA
jgi:hypothetical protein